MKNVDSAMKLANVMTKIGELAHKETKCIITDMNQPVGHAVGNILEVIEAIKILKGIELPEDIEKIITELGANMLLLANKVSNIEEGKAKILENLKNGKGYEKFVQLVQNQGGDISYIENTDKFNKARFILPIIANKSGIVSKLDALTIGKLSVYLGAGRIKKEDKIEPEVGFVLNKKIGDSVENGEVLGYVHANDEKKAINVLKENIYEIS